MSRLSRESWAADVGVSDSQGQETSSCSRALEEPAPAQQLGAGGAGTQQAEGKVGDGGRDGERGVLGVPWGLWGVPLSSQIPLQTLATL